MSVLPRLVLANFLLTLGLLLGFRLRTSVFLWVPVLCVGAVMRCRGGMCAPSLTTTFIIQLAGVVVLFDGERQRRGSVLLLGYQASSNNSTADALLWGLRLRHSGSRFG